MDNREEFITQKSKKRNRKVHFYYSFLTLILVVCFLQVTYSAALNISKIFSHKAKLNKMLVLEEEAKNYNERLKSEIEDFGSLKSLEAIARNNLKMASEDEVLVIINDTKQKEIEHEAEILPQEEVEEKKDNNNLKFLNYLKSNNLLKFKKQKNAQN